MSTIYFSDHTIVVHTYYFSRTETFHCKNRFRGIFLSLLQWRQQQKQSFVFRNKLPFHFTQCDKNWKKWCHKKCNSTIPQFLPSKMEQKTKIKPLYTFVSTQKRLKSLQKSIYFEFCLELVNSNQGEFKP